MKKVIAPIVVVKSGNLKFTDPSVFTHKCRSTTIESWGDQSRIPKVQVFTLAHSPN